MGDFIAGVLLAFCVAAIVLLGIHGNGQREMFNNFAKDCLKAGGMVSETHKSFTSTRYECVTNGKTINLPGYN